MSRRGVFEVVVTFASYCFLIRTVVCPFEGRGSSFSSWIEKSLLGGVTTRLLSMPGAEGHKTFSDLWDIGYIRYPVEDKLELAV
jgi:hypothetical protein